MSVNLYLPLILHKRHAGLASLNFYQPCHYLLPSEINPFPNKPWFSCLCSTCLMKTLWEKEKLLVKSIFSFSHSAFYPLTHYQILDSSKLKEFADDNFKFDENGSNLSIWVENIVGKGEIARYEQFLLFPQCLQKACFPGVKRCHCVGMGFKELSAILSKGKIVVCKIVNLGESRMCRFGKG